VREDLRSLGELDAPASTLQAIRRATVGEEARLGRWRGSWAQSWLAAAAAVAVIGLGLGIWSLQGPGPEQGRVMSAGPELTHGPEATPTADELAEARAQARLALSMVATVGRRAGVELHRDVVVRQLLRPAIESLERWREPIVPKGATGGGRADGHSAG
jgi:hypothetical protein